MRYIGIDLGTTNTVMSCMDGSSEVPEVVRNNAGEVVTPSAVFINEFGASVGTTAKRRIKTQPDQTVYMAKRFMGEYKVWNILGQDYTPVDISSMILGEVFSSLPESDDDYRCVITCPASYNQAQRSYVVTAAEKAGIRTPVIINEPTAAALSYLIPSEVDEATLVIFDLGGGTLDISIVYCDKKRGVYEVLASDGKPYLGGADWDKVIEDMIYDLAAETFDQTADALRNDVVVSSFVKNEAERIKKELSDFDFDDTLYVKGEPIDVSITRDEFRKRTGGLLNEALSMIQMVMDIAVKNMDQHPDVKRQGFDGVVLVGGSCKMPQVKTAIEEMYPQFQGKVWVHDPDLSVSKGAAYYARDVVMEEIPGKLSEAEPAAAAVAGGKKVCQLGEVLSTTFGIKVNSRELGREVCYNMLFKNDRIPASSSSTFKKRYDGNSLSDIVYINMARDRETEQFTDLKYCTKLVEYSMELPFKAKAGEEITTTYSIGEDGQLVAINRIRGFEHVYRFNAEDYTGSFDNMTKKSD